MLVAMLVAVAAAAPQYPAAEAAKPAEEQHVRQDIKHDFYLRKEQSILISIFYTSFLLLHARLPYELKLGQIYLASSTVQLRLDG